MSNIHARFRKLFMRTHTFIPRRSLELIAEGCRLSLENIKKRGELEKRIRLYTKLLHEAEHSEDSAHRLDHLQGTDEELRQTVLLRACEELIYRNGYGIWVNKLEANDFINAIALAKAEIRRQKE